MTRRLRSCVRQFQEHLEQYYALEGAPSVEDFVQEGAAGSREQVLVREDPDGLSIALVLPPAEPPEEPLGPSDEWAQLIEGVSHFLVLSERARRELSTTQLELELQAEIDKFVLLSWLLVRRGNGAQEDGGAALRELHERLYEDVRFLHEEDTVEGVRYRLANRWAARFTYRMMEQVPPEQWRDRLRAFYHAGPTEKLSLLNAA